MKIVEEVIFGLVPVEIIAYCLENRHCHLAGVLVQRTDNPRLIRFIAHGGSAQVKLVIAAVEKFTAEMDRFVELDHFFRRVYGLTFAANLGYFEEKP